MSPTGTAISAVRASCKDEAAETIAGREQGRSACACAANIHVARIARTARIFIPDPFLCTGPRQYEATLAPRICVRSVPSGHRRHAGARR